MAAPIITQNIISTNNLFALRDFAARVQESGGTGVALIDIDDTTVVTGHAAAGHLGGMKWREDLRKEIEALKNEGLMGNGPLFEYLTLFIAMALKVHAVQEDLPELFKELNAAKIQVLWLTARGNYGENAWYKLNIGGVDKLTKKQLLGAGFTLFNYRLPYHAQIYQDAIIFSQNKDKGELVTELIQKKIISARAIAFVDDKLKAVEAVAKAVLAQGVTYYGVHSTRMEEQEGKEYDLVKSTLQLMHLFREGCLMTKEALDQEVKNNHLRPEVLFREALLKLNKFFKSHMFYNNSYLNPEVFFTTITQSSKDKTCGCI